LDILACIKNPLPFLKIKTSLGKVPVAGWMMPISAVRLFLIRYKNRTRLAQRFYLFVNVGDRIKAGLKIE
jgi:hypothetical protein